VIRIPPRDARKSVRPRPFQRKTARDVELVTEGGQLNFKKGMQDWLQARYGLALRTSFVDILAVKSQLRRMQGERAGSRKSQTGPGSGTAPGPGCGHFAADGFVLWADLLLHGDVMVGFWACPRLWIREASCQSTDDIRMHNPRFKIHQKLGL
jgi:hypothetical protein